MMAAVKETSVGKDVTTRREWLYRDASLPSLHIGCIIFFFNVELFVFDNHSYRRVFIFYLKYQINSISCFLISKF